MATILSQIAHILLLVHALGNILQGVVTLADPDRYRRMTGTLFTGAPDKALGAIGLGAIGIGFYQLIFVLQRNTTLILATIPYRLFLMGIMWSWGHQSAVIYDGVVIGTCFVAIFMGLS